MKIKVIAFKKGQEIIMFQKQEVDILLKQWRNQFVLEMKEFKKNF